MLGGLGALVASLAAAAHWTHGAWSLVLVVPILFVGACDLLQTRQAVRRNFPVIGRARYLLEAIRPEINQYFVESNTSGTPFSREARSVVYQRAKNVIDTLPFGTERDVYETGYEWINHSIRRAASVRALAAHPVRRARTATQPYLASRAQRLGAMSFGSLSRTPSVARSTAARRRVASRTTRARAVSARTTSRAGMSSGRSAPAYFGARDPDGNFSPEQFAQRARLDSVKMIEIKLSQGAKPGHGGILPAAKLTPEIAAIRGVPLGRDVLSPPAHAAFSTPIELLRVRRQAAATCRAESRSASSCASASGASSWPSARPCSRRASCPISSRSTGPKGGRAPRRVEFSNVVGTPLVRGAGRSSTTRLEGIGVRSHVRVLASGRVVTGFDIAHKLAIGADAVYCARAMMFALGCIQARRCNTNSCPTGVATQNPELVRGLVVSDKATRVANFHRNTVKAFCEIIAAAGLDHPRDLRPWHIVRRVSPTEVRTYAEIFDYLQPGDLLAGRVPDGYRRAWDAARPDSFTGVAPGGLSRALLA